MPHPHRLSLVALEPRTTPATFTVNTTDDNGNNAGATPGSLRAAILAANAGVDDIVFAILGGGVRTITPPAPLPTVTDTVNIDATTQTGFNGTLLVRLSGSKAGTGANGFFLLNHSGSSVRGFAVGGFDGAGVRLDGLANGRVVGSFIGTDTAGTAADPNGVGVLLINNASANAIGGFGQDRNVISGNRDDGVRLTGGANQNTVSVSNIGTDAGGSAQLANGGNGVEITGGAAKNVIGGTAAGSGTDLGNGVDRVRVENKAGTTASSGQDAITNNTVSANTANGVTVRDGSRFVRIETNLIFDHTGVGIAVTPTSNNGLAAPTITSADATTTGVVVTGTVAGRPNAEYTLNLFNNTKADPSGSGEGKTPVGTAKVSTGGDGSGTFTLSANTTTGTFFTDTATGDTFGFSNAQMVESTVIPGWPPSGLGSAGPAR